jgi:hypothetical protein
MRLHAILMITASAMVALSVFFVLRPPQTDTAVGRPYGGLIGSKCTPAPDNDHTPLEYSCEGP